MFPNTSTYLRASQIFASKTRLICSSAPVVKCLLDVTQRSKSNPIQSRLPSRQEIRHGFAKGEAETAKNLDCCAAQGHPASLHCFVSISPLRGVLDCFSSSRGIGELQNCIRRGRGYRKAQLRARSTSDRPDSWLRYPRALQPILCRRECACDCCDLEASNDLGRRAVPEIAGLGERPLRTYFATGLGGSNTFRKHYDIIRLRGSLFRRQTSQLVLTNLMEAADV